ncbi:type II toxin-antitoxin system RatA family toxin [Streptomyces sp. ST2-7A]|uniref:type II toxin-antitoxin system RatA family toxin n=1 Tax=Streptomyces sp. ST2-7A TaxID=2907214 RepID=UPI001F297DDC|nr:SRPBCC family protein [Streptomyces sp. ST2-7A]MCE7082337.1 SRPBCC family protein [Streptomyces sp. ST2-7A]
MTTRKLTATVPAEADEVWRLLREQQAFPRYSDDIRSVSPADDGADTDTGPHTWVLGFRGGTATWTQRTRLVGEGGQTPRRIEFLRVSGEFQQLMGAWTVTELPQGCEIDYEVHYRTGVPHLAGAIDSAVGRVLVRAAHRIITAVGGPARITAGEHHLQDLIAA